MYKNELDNQIRSNKLSRSIALYGACGYQLKLYEEIILDLWGKEGVLKFYFDEYDFKSARLHLSQASLFGDKNILVLKVEKAPPTKEIEELVSLCDKSDINYLLLIFFGEDAKAKTLIKPFGKNFVRFFTPNLQEALTFLANKAKKIGLNINNYNLQYLYQTHNEDLSLSINELEKLLLLEKEVETKDIDSLVCGMGEISVDDFINRLFNKKDIVQTYKTISENGIVDEIKLINSLQNYVATLFAFQAYIKMNGSYDAVKILGFPLPPQLAKERANHSIKIKAKTIDELLKCLVRAEYRLKTDSHLEKKSFMLSTVIELQGIL